MGGFDGTSNVLAGKLFGIPVRGTHAHSYITSFSSFSDLTLKTLVPKNGGESQDLLELAKKWRHDLLSVFKLAEGEANDGELTALVSFAIAFPDGFVALIDTYDVKKSGLYNFCAVALALNDLEYRAIGIRLDSGDLAYLASIARKYFKVISEKYNLPWFKNLTIMASNDINEETILSLNEQRHTIDCFGIGTHLVTCQRQPALGGVFKMVELNNEPRMKLSQEVSKLTLPCRKDAYRLYGEDKFAMVDLLQHTTEPPPQINEMVLCRHPFEESKRAYAKPARVDKLHKVFWKDGAVQAPLPTLEAIRKKVIDSLQVLRTDIKRDLNPTPYKVALSNSLYNFVHQLWLKNAPIGELS